MTPTDLGWLQAFGPAVGLTVVLFIFQARGHLVPKRIYDRALADADQYRDAANTAIQASAQQARAVEALTTTMVKLTENSEKQLELQRRTLELLERLVPEGRSAA